MFKLSLQPVGSGWLDVFIKSAGFTKQFVASEVGSDLCLQLIHVASSLLNGLDKNSQPITVEMYGEPEGLILHFAHENDKLILVIYSVKDFDDPLENQLRKCLSKSEVVASVVTQAIYGALKELLVYKGLSYLSNQWQEFPLGSFLNLHRKMGNNPKLLNNDFKSELECLVSILEFK